MAHLRPIGLALAALGLSATAALAQQDFVTAHYKIEIFDPQTKSKLFVERGGSVSWQRLELCESEIKSEPRQKRQLDVVRAWGLRTASGGTPVLRVALAECRKR